jgi:hypothetical protein
MLDGLAALTHRFGVLIKAMLHCFEQMLMLPTNVVMVGNRTPPDRIR